ncbi:MAG: ImmA/IrrE family metallo-endopeptidase [Pseudomonadota bacterium]
MATLPASVQAILETSTSDYPTDLIAVSEALGVPIYSTALAEGVSGVLVRDSGSPSGFVIHVDKDEPAARQRFTAAHELGHFVLHKHLIGDRVEDNYLLRSEGLSNAVEAEANRFAADLLMPRAQIARAMEAGITGADALADAFGVSLTAMSIRLGLPT